MSDKFNKHYEMQVRPSYRTLRRVPRSYQQNNMWQYTISDAMLYQEHVIPVEEVECVEILMPKDRLEEIENMIAWYEGQERHMTAHADIVEQHRADERIRIENPTVRNAYEKYQMLLEMCRK